MEGPFAVRPDKQGRNVMLPERERSLHVEVRVRCSFLPGEYSKLWHKEQELERENGD